MKRKYVRMEVFALRSAGGGSWEEDILIDGKDYTDCYKQACKLMKTLGWAFEIKVTICKKNGENFQ